MSLTWLQASQHAELIDLNSSGESQQNIATESVVRQSHSRRRVRPLHNRSKTKMSLYTDSW